MRGQDAFQQIQMQIALETIRYGFIEGAKWGTCLAAFRQAIHGCGAGSLMAEG